MEVVHTAPDAAAQGTAPGGVEGGAGGSQAFDVVIVGGGPGGYAAALYGASAGLSIAIVELDKVGGTCLHRGCIPAKAFLETAAVYRTVNGSEEFGIRASTDPGGPVVEFAVSQKRKQQVVEQLFNGLAGLLKGRGVTTFDGTGMLLPGRKVRITAADGSTSEIEGRHVILAAGSVPRTLPGFEIDGRLVMTSDEFLALEELPSSAAVIGGGVVGCEFASLLGDLGTSVTVLEALPSILSGCDEDMVRVLSRSFRRRGIDVKAGTRIHGHTPDPSGRGTVVSFGDGEKLAVDAVVVSVGRRPRTEGLLADGTGVTLDGSGFVTADQWMRTTADGVWAVGDVVPTPQLAHVGYAEAIVAIKGILGEPAVPVDYGRVPWAIYSHPEIAYAGMTEAAAREAGIDVVVKKDPFGGNSRARIIGDLEGMVKIVAERKPDGSAGRILGVHLVGPWVTEQLGSGYLAVNWEATPDEVAQFVQPHPSLSETFGETMLALTGRGLHLA